MDTLGNWFLSLRSVCNEVPKFVDGFQFMLNQWKLRKAVLTTTVIVALAFPNKLGCHFVQQVWIVEFPVGIVLRYLYFVN